MKFSSTKKASPEVDFKTALFHGAPSDGGLYMPIGIPTFSKKELQQLTTLDEVAFAVLRKWIPAAELPDTIVQHIVRNSFTFSLPLVQVGEYSVLELFHGPTMAFKDIAAGVLSQLFAYYLAQEKKKITLLVATSGDTGGAIAQAFANNKQVSVIVLYPQGKVSKLQEEQITRAGENVMAIAVDGVFDDCQRFVKRAFGDTELQHLNLSTANSINIGRLLPQVIYYFWAYVQSGRKKMRFVVPSGNMGNVTAAILAHKMGMPLDSLIIATNENDIAVTYYKTGVYKNKKTKQTLSTAMDIGSPSNFERILAIFQHNHEKFRALITAKKVTNAKTIWTIQQIYTKHHYLLDFHTAVGMYAAKKIPSTAKTVVVSTASPVKFAKEITGETGIAVDDTQVLKLLRIKQKNVIRSPKDYTAIKRILLKKLHRDV